MKVEIEQHDLAMAEEVLAAVQRMSGALDGKTASFVSAHDLDVLLGFLSPFVVALKQAQERKQKQTESSEPKTAKAVIDAHVKGPQAPDLAKQLEAARAVKEAFEKMQRARAADDLLRKFNPAGKDRPDQLDTKYGKLVTG